MPSQLNKYVQIDISLINVEGKKDRRSSVGTLRQKKTCINHHQLVIFRINLNQHSSLNGLSGNSKTGHCGSAQYDVRGDRRLNSFFFGKSPSGL